MKKRTDPNRLQEDRAADTRRWQAQDNNGHDRGSNLARSNEQDVDALRQAEQRSRFNKTDKRSQGWADPL